MELVLQALLLSIEGCELIPLARGDGLLCLQYLDVSLDVADGKPQPDTRGRGRGQEPGDYTREHLDQAQLLALATIGRGNEIDLTRHR